MNPIPQKKFVKKFIPSSFELPNFEPTTSYTTRLQPFPPSFFQSHSSCLFRLVSFVQTRSARLLVKMHLMYTLDPAGKRVYTLKKVIGAEVTKSGAPGSIFAR
ncbi:hypothetical protein EYC84_011576 [Monilinia fructicola]|uniref:Uncharacterized protein n=1 Tax=Monilinia fructicola TaxID=38448 RepID=A0A5M9J9X0_MONFR|nr:hypothetical protein EYC84_011576 [Monilinia fructicola]